jgi:hypothetical protein
MDRARFGAVSRADGRPSDAPMSLTTAANRETLESIATRLGFAAAVSRFGSDISRIGPICAMSAQKISTCLGVHGT